MTSSGPKQPQSGGELSGLLRQSEALQREVEKAMQELKSEIVEGQDAARHATIVLSGDASARSVRLQLAGLSVEQRRVLEEALLVALRGALERLAELRRKRLASVTKGLPLPGLFQ